MKGAHVVHVVGTGTIGEPLIGLLASFRKELGIGEVTFHKRTPLLTDRSKVLSLQKRGAKLAVDRDAWEKFSAMGMTPAYDDVEVIERASVVIDFTPVGNETKNGSMIFMGKIPTDLSLREASLASGRCTPGESTTRCCNLERINSSRS